MLQEREARLARAQGALLGQLTGDALGAMVEFQTASEIRAAYPDGLREMGASPIWGTLPGQPTDDSEMALALARTLVTRGFDLASIRGAYLAWLDSRPFDVGRTTRLGLYGQPVEESQANGGLMRISPLGIFGHALEVERLVEMARAECGLTHPNPVCRDASAVFAAGIAHAVRTGASPEEVWEVMARLAREDDCAREVREAVERAVWEPPSDFHFHMGWVKNALQNAVYRMLHASSLEEGVIDTVMAGGDTDTNAAIAGALLGAVHGVDAVPTSWREVVLSVRADHRSPVPRPPAYWPVDALELAAQLLDAGAQIASEG